MNSFELLGVLFGKKNDESQFMLMSIYYLRLYDDDVEVKYFMSCVF